MHLHQRFLSCRPQPEDQRLAGWPYDAQEVDLSLPLLERRLDKDRSRVIHSASVRRLQLLPQQGGILAQDSDRRLLSLALERQQVGRRIVHLIYRKLHGNLAKHELARHELAEKELTEQEPARHELTGLDTALGCLVDVGCLLCDVGRPPFGQAGELAVCGWFDSHLPEFGGMTAGGLSVDKKEGHAVLAELCRFDARAQALRSIVTLEGISLTHAQSATLLGRHEPWPEQALSGPFTGNSYRSEAAIETAMRGALGLTHRSRHPAAYLVDAADAIAQTLARLEAIVERGLIDPAGLMTQLKDTFQRRQGQRPTALNERCFCRHGVVRRWSLGGMLDWALARYQRDLSEGPGQFFHYLRLALGRILVNHGADAFLQRLAEVREGAPRVNLLAVDPGCRILMESLEDLATRLEYLDPDRERQELDGFRTICGLLDAALPALRLPMQEFHQLLDRQEASSPVLGAWAAGLPAGVVRAYRQAISAPAEGMSGAVQETYHRGRLVHDWICSRTETSALEENMRLRVSGRQQS